MLQKWIFSCPHGIKHCNLGLAVCFIHWHWIVCNISSDKKIESTEGLTVGT